MDYDYNSDFEQPEIIAGIVVGAFILVVVIPFICCCVCCGWCCFGGSKQAPVNIIQNTQQSQSAGPSVVQLNNTTAAPNYAPQNASYGVENSGWDYAPRQNYSQFQNPGYNYNAYQHQQSRQFDQRYHPLTEFGLQRNQSFQYQQEASRAPRNYLGQNSYDIYAKGSHSQMAHQFTNGAPNQMQSTRRQY